MRILEFLQQSTELELDADTITRAGSLGQGKPATALRNLDSSSMRMDGSNAIRRGPGRPPVARLETKGAWHTL
jgi:hypothetical protein